VKKRRSSDDSILGTSFLDVLANTIGGLAFLLVMAVLMVGMLSLSPPRITTERLPDGFDNTDYGVWLGAREGGGLFRWRMGDGAPPPGLELDPVSGFLHGRIALPPEAGERATYTFSVICQVQSGDEGKNKPLEDKRNLSLTVARSRPLEVIPLRIRTAAELPAAYRGQPYPLVFAAEGGQPPYSWAWKGNSPKGLSLNADGTVAGSPEALGACSFEIIVQDRAQAAASQSVTLTVAEKFPPPPDIPPLEALTEKMPPAVARQDYAITLAAQGGWPPYTWSPAEGAPAWLKSESGSVFAGRPDVGDVRKNSVVWEVRDSKGKQAKTKAIEFEVLPPVMEEPPPLKILTTRLPEGRAGEPYQAAVAVAGGYPPFKWAVAAQGALPAGIAFDPATGLFDGTPEAQGAADLKVSVEDSGGRRAEADYTIHIWPAPAPVEILTRGAPLGRVDQPYDLALSAVGGYSPYSWRIEKGELPAGIEFEEATGRLSGTPQKAGTWNFTVAVKDAAGQPGAKPLDIEMEIFTRKDVPLLRLTTKGLPELQVGRETHATLACEGGAPPYSWRIDSPAAGAGAIEGLRVEENRIVGAPRNAGEIEVKLTAMDATGQEASGVFLLRIRRTAPFWVALLLGIIALALALILAVVVPILLRRWKRTRPIKELPLRILSAQIPSARASFEYSVQLACEGGAPPYKWSLAAGDLPPGMALTPEGLLHGTPFEGIAVDSPKTMDFTVEVEDQRGDKVQQKL